MLNRTAAIVLELYRYDTKERTVEQYGFAVYPLVEYWESRQYLQSGYNLLQVFKGAPPMSMVNKFVGGQGSSAMEIVNKLRQEGLLVPVESL